MVTEHGHRKTAHVVEQTLVFTSPPLPPSPLRSRHARPNPPALPPKAPQDREAGYLLATPPPSLSPSLSRHPRPNPPTQLSDAQESDFLVPQLGSRRGQVRFSAATRRRDQPSTTTSAFSATGQPPSPHPHHTYRMYSEEHECRPQNMCAPPSAAVHTHRSRCLVF